jgi:hypothetical protein
MSNEITKHMLSVYEQASPTTLFLSSLFQARPENFYNSAEIEIDVVRNGEPVAVVVQDFSVLGRYNSQEVYTNKSFIAPIHSETGTLTSYDLIKRVAGADPFADPDYNMNATTKAVRLVGNMTNKIKRAIEVQASQVLQTGKLALKGEAGNILYNLDYKPKATHFPTAGVEWTNAAAVPLADLKSLAQVIRTDGKSNPDTLIFGCEAWTNFIKNAEVQANYSNRRIEQGNIATGMLTPNGSTFTGTVTIGSYEFNIWLYNGRYDDVETGTSTPYVADDKVIMLSSSERLDATFGGIPMFGNPAAGILPFLPARVSDQAANMDIFMNAWLEPNRRHLFVSAESRPLMIPTAIDSFGCLDTVA